MNLKEAYRYQNCIESFIRTGCVYVNDSSHALSITKNHLISKTNPDEADFVETVETEDFCANDTVIAFLVYLLEERKKLTTAIIAAKQSVAFCYDSEIDCNKLRRTVSDSINRMLKNYKEKTETNKERAYKFDIEGKQAMYYYDVDVTFEENYDRTKAKNIARTLIEEADKTSSLIDAASVNTLVDYTPLFSANDTFEDAVKLFENKVLTEN